MGSGDSVILKKIEPISKIDMDFLLKETVAIAKSHNLKRSDIDRAIKEVRNAKNPKKK